VVRKGRGQKKNGGKKKGTISVKPQKRTHRNRSMQRKESRDTTSVLKGYMKMAGNVRGCPLASVGDARKFPETRFECVESGKEEL